MLTSIFFLTSVIDAVTKQTFARPSCMTTAARSAFRVTSVATSILSNETVSHKGLVNSNFLCSKTGVFYIVCL